MAVDEAILEAVGKGEALPTLRLYAWEPPCLSLGYAQPVADVDMEGLDKRGWVLVRRPTGGRAILHTDELTYSVIGSTQEPLLAGSVLESYQRLSKALIEALNLMNIPAISETQPPLAMSQPKGPVCFEVPSNYEITVGGKKLIGSAQARRKGGVLQHGSLPLYGDLTRITQVLNFKTESNELQEDLRTQATQRLKTRAITAEQSLGTQITWETAASTFVKAFQNALELEFIYDGLSEFERSRADELVDNKYNHPSWTNRI